MHTVGVTLLSKHSVFDALFMACMPAYAALAWCNLNLIQCTFLWSLQFMQPSFLKGIKSTGVHDFCHPIPHPSVCELILSLTVLI